MHLTVAALIISILGLLSSFVLVGIIPSLVSLILGIKLLLEERTIEVVRIVAISLVGVILPIIMYVNTYGFSFPKNQGSDKNAFTHIIADNYERLGIYNRSGKKKEDVADLNQMLSDIAPETESTAKIDNHDDREKVTSENTQTEEALPTNELPEIFESRDSISSNEKNKGGVISVAASDDDMPSYGGLPIGTMLVAQYFREDDHNCNPVLVLRNETGDVCRYECVFTARDSEGTGMATSEKTVEVVRNKGVFVFEGRFDKRDLGGKIPESYEFTVSKRSPYEKDLSDSISVYTAVQGTSAVLTAQNKSDKRVKVDAYVLCFDGSELVDCMWMIPQNSGEVYIDPGSSASIQGDAYYRFDRVETYYTAYEAVGGA